MTDCLLSFTPSSVYTEENIAPTGIQSFAFTEDSERGAKSDKVVSI